MDGSDVYQGFIDRGYAPVQAAVLAGNILQESGGNPAAVNEKEGANGFLQWRQDRLTGLQGFAKARGTDPADPNTQMDFIGSELAGSEKKSAPAFFNAPDLESANAALKGYIRYGDNSQGVRLANAKGLLGAAAPAPTAAPATATPSPQPAVAPVQAPPRAVLSFGGPSAPANLAALTAVPQLQNILPARPNPLLGGRAPFSFGGNT